MLDKVLNCATLPTLPTVAVDLLALTRDPETELSAIGDLVEKDAALASKVLRTVNSTYYGLSQPCPTITRALAYLGLNTVKSLVLGFSLVDMSHRYADGFDLMDYWRRCLFSAAAARRIAMLTGSCDPDEAFLGGLLQDVGMLAIHTTIGDQYSRMLNQCKNDHLKLPKVEREVLGFTHAEAGARLSERWRLPEQIVGPIRFHHADNSSVLTSPALIRTVALALQVATLMTTRDRKAAFQRMDAMSKASFSFKPEQSMALLQGSCDDATELARLLEVQVGTIPDPNVLLAQAEDARIRHTFAVQLETEQLREARAQLAREASTDGLTGVGNRKFFDKQVQARFRYAKKHNEPMAIILGDADAFKLINDSLGHPAGDIVLREIAERLRNHAGPDGFVFRYGGEEFAIILPGMSRPEAAKVAEQLREAIAATPVGIAELGLDESSVIVTLSFGVAALEYQIAAQLTRPELLVQLADKALYAAKKAGRNCVRVFTPRRRSEAA